MEQLSARKQRCIYSLCFNSWQYCICCRTICRNASQQEDAFRYDRMVLAAASYDAGVFPIMQDFLHHLQAKAFQNRTVGLIENGSWAPTAAKTMRNILETMKNITIVEPVVTIKSVLKETDIPALDQLADALK